MKFKSIILSLILPALLATMPASAQDWQNRAFYEDATNVLAHKDGPKVIFLGDSITQLWIETHPHFFFDNGFIGRGISGQTSAHALLRFREEIVATGGDVAVILIGANDIARNAGPISLENIAGHIFSICEIAKANKVTPVLCSLIPAKTFYWQKNKDVRPDRDIPILNAMLEKYAKKHRIEFVDLFTPLADTGEENFNGTLPPYTKDGVHPSPEGYKAMEQALMPQLSKVIAKLPGKKECSLRLMSYNVRNAKGMDRATNYRRVASVIADTAPDAVAVQEVDSCTSRSKGFNVIQQLAKGAGFHWTFAPAIDYDGGKYGIGMLSRKAPISVKTVPLPGREEKRVLLIAEFDNYYYCCTHLSLTKEDRLSSLDIILKEMAGLNADKDIFIAGDFNAGPSSEFIAGMAEHFDFLTDTGVFTFPADKPDRTIDYIARYKAAGHAFKPERSSVLEAAVASDHRPVVCELDKN